MSKHSEMLLRELRAFALVSLYFGAWIGTLIFLKHLLLAEYDIHLYGWSAALVGTLILSKVVLVLEHVRIGAWAERQPAWIVVVLRTLLYAAGVVCVLSLEHGFRGWREHNGFLNAIRAGVAGTNGHHMLANTICILAALLGYNAFAVLRHRLGGPALLAMYLTPMDKHRAHAPDAER